ncbi:MAG: hypothetical protein EB043_02370 [Actinobacteria bacterium]|nr:hypothetical protein [Actinomycetota bacterium]NCW34836.1 hypothetical protein [Actinomycetota bacterium]NCZ73722.1 hypothetical protein [Actinomycetota bacterium]NDB31273.1 hypothetical protein [Actinomycetota bacterium]NDC12593.1 hypothetical protein [Actinomycetota bacterium]
MLSLAESSTSAPVSALVWLLIPLFALVGAIGYVIWVSRFQDKFEKKTNRSVGKFQRFQDSFRNEKNSGDKKEK